MLHGSKEEMRKGNYGIEHIRPQSLKQLQSRREKKKSGLEDQQYGTTKLLAGWRLSHT